MTISWQGFTTSASLTKPRDRELKSRDVEARDALSELAELGGAQEHGQRRDHQVGHSNSCSEGDLR